VVLPAVTSQKAVLFNKLLAQYKDRDRGFDVVSRDALGDCALYNDASFKPRMVRVLCPYARVQFRTNEI